jgi:pimeloyl-ACP methyl ester carboxylesterase
LTAASKSTTADRRRSAAGPAPFGGRNGEHLAVLADPNRRVFGPPERVAPLRRAPDVLTLVGHSWGGYAITGAASRLEDRLRMLVYWAAFVPVPGKGLIDDVAPEFQAMLARSRRHRAT